jgi:hypothetical protein
MAAAPSAGFGCSSTSIQDSREFQDLRGIECGVRLRRRGGVLWFVWMYDLILLRRTPRLVLDSEEEPLARGLRNAD